MKWMPVLVASLCVACSTPPEKSGNNTSNNTTTATNNTTGETNNTTGTNSTTGGSNNGDRMPLLTTNELDLLFVVDNSGSMCQEQAALRNNAELMFAALDEAGVDFQVGITTTDMNADYPLEPIAQPGRLQSTPQPVPGFDRSCHVATDSSGQPIQGDFKPIRDAIAAAVNCMQTPDETFNEVSNADIECALYASPAGCSVATAGCGGGTPCTAEDLFPAASSYRAIPKVLRASDYANLDALNADFACASLVGTRGYGIEKGLAAAVEAVAPRLTGGAVGGGTVDESAPNHGLVRQGAKFGLVFITDENDCSHDGSLSEDSACGGDVCEFANAADATSSPLIEPAALQADFMANLRDSKELPELTEWDVFAGSIHGNFKRFTGMAPSDSECASATWEGIAPTCATSLGRAYSGDRYDRFLQAFPSTQIFPVPSGDEPLVGWICTGDIRPALQSIANTAITALDF